MRFRIRTLEPQPRRGKGTVLAWLAPVCLALSWGCWWWPWCRPAAAAPAGEPALGPGSGGAAGLSYTNHQVAEVPWSIHVVRWPRTNSAFAIYSAHAGRGALGLATLSSQIGHCSAAWGLPVAGVNGDFYQRDRAYAGDPRGLQIIEGQLISGPVGNSASFWVDGEGQPYVGNVTSRFQVTWPSGLGTTFGLNEDRSAEAAVLYTPALGASTHTAGGRELVLEPVEGRPWLPLRAAAQIEARVREVREGGDTSIPRGGLVLSVGPRLAARVSKVEVGAVLLLSTAASVNLGGAHAAISGGPVLVRNGKVQRVDSREAESYQFSSMQERHPRTAIGWNREHFFLVQVDGRQKSLSVGMTLKELAAYLLRLGCQEALNLDGGGSATLWYAGRVRNRPCDGREREIANSLVVLYRERSAVEQEGSR